MKKSIAISIGYLMVAAIAGCKYGPDYIDPFGCPVEESSKYALAPNTRWTSLRYGECPVLSKAGVWELRILKDGHRVLGGEVVVSIRPGAVVERGTRTLPLEVTAEIGGTRVIHALRGVVCHG